MALIQWKNEFSVNVVEIDRQHKKLIQMINDLSDAMKAGKGKEVLGKILDGLVSYTGTHFAMEEKYFEQFKYPESSPHKKEHADFVKKATEFRDGYANGKLGLSLQVMDFLSDWLQHHILIVDKKYSPFFNANGLS
jgi:hemerythrin